MGGRVPTLVALGHGSNSSAIAAAIEAVASEASLALGRPPRQSGGRDLRREQAVQLGELRIGVGREARRLAPPPRLRERCVDDNALSPRQELPGP